MAPLKRITIDAEQLNNAIKSVKNGTISLYSASELTGISRNTLCRIFQHGIDEKKSTKFHENKLHPRVSIEVFTTDEEHQLLSNIKDYVSTHKVFLLKTVQEHAYRFAKQKNKLYPISWEKHKMADLSWLQKFYKKYNEHALFHKPDIRNRVVGVPKVTSIIPIKQGTPLTTFLRFKAALDKCPSSLPPTNIWNIDEIIIHNPLEILTKEMLSFSAASSESNSLTIISAVNAGGDTIPPMIIFPYIDYKDFVLDGAPPETIGAINTSGGLNEDLFLEFFRHFLRYAKPSKDLPCIVLLDNHESHMCLPVHQLAKEKSVLLITFQPHENHKVQPINKGVSDIFKCYYSSAVKELLSTTNYVGKKLYIRDIATIVGKVFPKAFTQTNIIEGFRVTGFYPINETKRPDLKPLLSDMSKNLTAIDHNLSQDAENQLALFQDAENQLALFQDAENQLALSQDAENQLALFQDAENQLALSQDAKNQLALSQDVEDQLALSQDAEDQLALSQDAENQLALSQDAEDQLTLPQDADDQSASSQHDDDSPSSSFQRYRLQIPSSSSIIKRIINLRQDNIKKRYKILIRLKKTSYEY